MTGKERVVKMRRRKALKKAKTFSLFILDIVVTMSLLGGEFNTDGHARLLPLGAGTVLLMFNYLALLWSVPTMLKIQGELPWLRKLLIKIAGTELHRNRPRAMFLRGIVIALGLTAATLYLLFYIFR